MTSHLRTAFVPHSEVPRGESLPQSEQSLNFDVSTDPIPAPERFEFFCDVVAANYLGFDAAGSDASNFVGRMSGSVAGQLVITHTETSPAYWTRTRRSMLDGEEAIMVSLLQEGDAFLRQAGGDYRLQPGSISIFPTTMPSEVAIMEKCRSLSIKLPRNAVETALRPGLHVSPAVLNIHDSMARLLFGYVQSVMALDQQLCREAAELAGRHISDLVALAIGANRDAIAEMAGGTLKAARTDAILRAIAKDFASPFMSPATIGTSLGISERHVHRLLEETNRTFYEHLLEARLCHAYRLLTAPHSLHLPISIIASDSGFSNVPYFNRAFRARFGDSPSGIRSARVPDACK